jgi:hypothetical protein
VKKLGFQDSPGALGAKRIGGVGPATPLILGMIAVMFSSLVRSYRGFTILLAVALLGWGVALIPLRRARGRGGS